MNASCTTSGNSSTPAATRFWLTVLCFAIANSGIWFVWQRTHASARRDIVRVEQFLPGDGATVGREAKLAWQFNIDMARPGSEIVGDAPAAVTPPVAGKWRWANTRTLEFVPEHDLPRATRVQFRLSPQRLRTPDGFALPAAYESSVVTTPLRLESVRQAAFVDGDRYILEFQFNDRVLPADLLNHLSLRADDGSAVQCHLHGEPVDRIVRVLTDSVPPGKNKAAHIHLALSPGLAGVGGPLGIDNEYETDVQLEQALAATGITAECPAKGQTVLRLSFNGAVDLESLKAQIACDPPVAFTVGSNYSGVELLGDFAPGTRYTVKIAKPPAGSNPRTCSREGTFSALIPDRSAGVWFDHAEGYLGSQGNRTLLAHAMNLRDLTASVYRVYDNNLVAWRNAGERYSWREIENFSQPIATKVVRIDGAKNQEHEIRVSLTDMLPASVPHDGVYRITLEENRTNGSGDDSGSVGNDGEYHYYPSASAVATLSDIGLTAKAGRDSVTAWAVSLKSAEPIANVRVRVFSSKNQSLGEAITDEHGLATIANVHPNEGETATVVLADVSSQRVAGSLATRSEHPADAVGQTWLDLRSSGWALADTDLAGKPYLRDGHEAFIYTDRGVYRPGETVHLRAIVRGREQQTPAPFPVRWIIRRPDLHEYRQQVAMLDSDGAASFSLSLPADLPTGQWTASIGLPGNTEPKAGASAPFGNASFQVEEFMPDRMKVAVSLGTGDRFTILDKPLVASVQTDYLFGRPASGLPAKLSARIDPEPFAPAGWSDWALGDTANLLSPAGHTTGSVKARRHNRAAEQTQTEGQAEATMPLDDNGHATWELDLKGLLSLNAERTSDRYMGPWRVSVAAGVEETGGRAVTVSHQIAVDALPDYLAIRTKGGTIARPAEPISFDVDLVAPDGKTSKRGADVEASLFRESWNTSLVVRNGRYRYDSTRVLDAVKLDGELTSRVSLRDGEGLCTVTTQSSGAYILRVRDKQTGAMSSLSFYVSDGSPWNDSVSRENPERLELVLLPDGVAEPGDAGVPDKKLAEPKQDVRYRVGQTARVLVRSPFAGRLLLTVESDGVISTQVIDMPKSQVVAPVEVTDAFRPNAYITATVVHAIDANAAWRTHRAFGATRLSLDPAGQNLRMTIAAAAEVRPRQALPVEVTVVDSDGAPVRDAAVTLAAVDEGILQLTSFTTPDPLGYFFGKRSLGVSSADIYSELMPEVARPDGVGTPGGDGDVEARHSTPVHARRVKPVSLVSEVLHTDDQGVARTSLNLPEFIGKLRLMVVSYAGARFGSADQNVLVRSPLLVQSSFPRFVAPGDRFDVPLVVFNNSQSEGDVKIVVGATSESIGLLRFDGANAHHFESALLHLPAGGQRTLACTLAASAGIGVAKIRVSAVMDQETFEENLELPVRPASPMITRGGYVSVMPDAPSKISVPGGMMPGTESVNVRVTPWPVLQLPTGLDYLERYPYGCCEQTVSTCFPLAFLGDIGPRIAPGVFEKQRVDDKLESGFYRLLGLQTSDGGLSMWPGERESWPWATIYAAHFLIEAEKAGHPVPEDLRRHLLAYARRLVDQGGDDADLVESQCYACYVLALAGKPNRSAMSRLGELTHAETFAESSDAGPQRASARMWLSLAWLNSGRRDVATSLLPQSPPLPRQGRQSGANIGSPVRDRALAISALLQVDPENPVIPALVQQLADVGAKKQWRSTQDAAFAVMAIGQYLRHEKSASPYRTAQVSLNGDPLATAQDGKPLDLHSDKGDFQVSITGDADARAYVSWTQNGVPMTPPADQDQGMKVRRRYFDESGDPLPGESVESGQLLRVELTVEAPAGTNNLVIEDLLPAGLEIENPNLKTSAAGEEQAHAAVQATGGEGQNAPLDVRRVDVRDDRLVLMAAMPQAGVGKYVYLVRAVAPGTFVIPPIRGECMYDEGMNSIANGGGTLLVEPANGSRLGHAVPASYRPGVSRKP